MNITDRLLWTREPQHYSIERERVKITTEPQPGRFLFYSCFHRDAAHGMCLESA